MSDDRYCRVRGDAHAWARMWEWRGRLARPDNRMFRRAQHHLQHANARRINGRLRRKNR